MLAFHQIRALCAELVADVPDDTGYPSSAAIAAQVAALSAAAPERVQSRQIGQASAGTPLTALRIGSSTAPNALRVIVVGVPRGDAPTGAAAILAFAKRLAHDPGLCATLGTEWWFVPCADPLGAQANAAWWAGPLSVAAYARQVVLAAPVVPRAITSLVTRVQPQLIIVLDNAPTGGFALRAQSSGWGTPWQGRDQEFRRLLELVGLPLDLGGTHSAAALTCGPGYYQLLTPDDQSADPYQQFRATLAYPNTVEALADLPAVATGVVVTPLFADYERREWDQTSVGRTRRAVAAEGIRLWREWFAFARTALDSLTPALTDAVLEQLPSCQTLRDSLRSAETILATGLGWAAMVPNADQPATVALAFAEGDAIRLIRLSRLATLLRCLTALRTEGAVAEAVVTAILERTVETRERWIDELLATGLLRPLRRDQMVGAQLGALLLALPER